MNWWTRLKTPQKVLIGTALGGVAYFGYRWYANKKAAAAATTASTTTAAGGEGTSTQGPVTGGSGYGYFGGGGPVTGGGTGGGPTTTPQPTAPIPIGGANPPTPKGTPKAPTAPPKSGSPAVGPPSNPYNLPTNSVAGKQQDEIGVITSSGHYSGRSVGGGAPVYFYIPKGLPGGGRVVTGLTKEQIAALPKGTEIYTPSSYYKDISSKTVTNSGI